MKEKIPFYDSLVLPYHFSKSLFWGTRYGLPGRRLRVIGVTGTNGKTTTSFMIWKMLNHAGHRTGLMTTVAWGTEKLHEQVEHMTTVDSNLLNQRIQTIANSGAEFLVLEITSHALAQFRAVGVPIEIAVMTNVTHEHLDYHKTFERYRDAKRKLFKKAKYGIVNADDPSAKLFASDAKQSITYGINSGKLRATAVKLGQNSVNYIIKGIKPETNLKIQTQLAGKFNVYNSLATVAVGRKLGIPDTEISAGIHALDQVEGRMVKINEGQPFTVIIDYAHTPDAFEKLLPDMKKATKGRLIVLFGSAGGRRDPSKREPQGRIAGKYADIVILTEEDDRDTPGMEIIEQIAVGARKSGKTDHKDLFFELNRPKAILLASQMAKHGDTVIFLGKGNEKTIERADGEHPYYEETEVRKALKKLKTPKK
ncbi:MAG: UDP-N-acetylmuramoyl-L-alanyl-D-glutamate--2,6-diaminopimelate ligase [Candidatus Nomurabacteria bacterium]|jgi:UDP-N-acetylmuramoyl-L-alanyl-D-glutamate--2,6-diaminopimelate ligase|nr:UDP-N-acetylmuramoyl-L-alanyl-D-glutamate--2,6-diaminopimelate ligase [Candidatus Nomurabacteria bacterium]